MKEKVEKTAGITIIQQFKSDSQEDRRKAYIEKMARAITLSEQRRGLS